MPEHIENPLKMIMYLILFLKDKLFLFTEFDLRFYEIYVKDRP